MHRTVVASAGLKSGLTGRLQLLKAATAFPVQRKVRQHERTSLYTRNEDAPSKRGV